MSKRNAEPKPAGQRMAAHLSSYWKMEASAVVLLPMIMVWLTEARLGWPTVIACAPMMLMLAIGAAYWRGKLQRIAQPDYDFKSLIQTIASLKIPALTLTVLAVLSTMTVWLVQDYAVGLPDKACATIATVLAALEYVNYYHRQLQHFDNRADFKRLLSGKGFRKSQMARDIESLKLASK